MRHRRPTPGLSIPIQLLEIKRLFPMGVIHWDLNQITWKGEVAPDEYSRIYTLEMYYRIGNVPRVFVKHPNLTEISGGRPLPHVYDIGKQQLCLYKPGVDLWTPQKLLGNTVMLWAVMWLRYFEIWLVTDVWLGGGEHPTVK